MVYCNKYGYMFNVVFMSISTILLNYKTLPAVKFPAFAANSGGI